MSSAVFNNLERPATQSVPRMTRTFTGTYDPDKKFSPAKQQPHSAIVTTQIPEDDLRRKLYESAAEIEPKE